MRKMNDDQSPWNDCKIFLNSSHPPTLNSAVNPIMVVCVHFSLVRLLHEIIGCTLTSHS